LTDSHDVANVLATATRRFHGRGQEGRFFRKPTRLGRRGRILFWHVADQLDYLVTLARLRILDVLPVLSRRRWPVGTGS
jgi:hypothetical protein